MANKQHLPPAAMLEVVLIHYPVVDRHGTVIGSAVTNLDIHDIARVCRTYGVGRYHIVTPYQDQQQLVRELLRHWQQGHGAVANPSRKEALDLVRLWGDVPTVIEAVTHRTGRRPLVVATGARLDGPVDGYQRVVAELRQKRPVVLLFGTGWGLADEILALAETSLPALQGAGTYNHLSVRAAAAIMLDRLLGRGREEQECESAAVWDT